MKPLEFVTVDVFTAERFRGNPLAVVLDASELSDDQMQAIATEFGYSESAFVLPPRNPENTAEVRIFTPTCEAPFAGHPNVGTAFVLGNRGDVFGKAIAETMRFEERAGLVTVLLSKAEGSVTGAAIRAPGPLVVGSRIAPADLAPCVSLAETDIATGIHMPCFASVGLKFIIAEVAGLDALGRAAPRIEPLGDLRTAYAHEESDCAIFLYTHVGNDHVRARMFAPFDNVPEDPATGSASAALGAYLASLSDNSANRQLLVEQGVEMGRRSLIHINVAVADGQFDYVMISGDCVEVMRGTIAV